MATTTPTPPRLIIADVDVGIDDAWALFMLLKAETAAHPLEHRLLAITCVAGNTGVDQVAINVTRVLQCAQRLDVPVYKGATRSFIEDTSANGPPFHGHNGLGDIPYDAASLDLSPIRGGEHAVNAMHRLVVTEHAAHSVTLVCCGPLTNVALAIRMYGEAFVRRVRDVHLMGGNCHGVGNTRARVSAEYNFYADPEAAWIVLEAFGAAAVPVHVLPWEACTVKTLKVPLSWRFEVLGRVAHPIVEWLNPVEEVIFAQCGESTYGMCDALMVGCLLFPGKLVRRQRRRRCTVELQGTHTRGQMVVDHVRGADEAPENVTVIELLDVQACMDVMMWTVDAMPASWAVGN